MNRFLFRLISAYKFGGFKYLLVAVQDVLCKTKNRRKMTRHIISTCGESDIESKAAAYFGMETGQHINYREPKRFNEKIQWLMIHEATIERANLTDKYLVRAFVERKLGAECLIELLGAWDSFEEIDFKNLPEQFVLKCNHGSGMNVVIKSKANCDYGRLKKTFDEWMKTNFAYNNFELHYKNIKPRIIAEKYIEELDGNLFDYKVHCFNGEPKFIQVIGNRDLEAHSAKQLIYDFEWKQLPWSFGDYPKYSSDLARPSVLEKLYDYSKKLSDGFSYVRVDFYIINDSVLFGEMTFTPNSGMYIYNQDFTEEVDYMLGEMIDLEM